MRTAWAWLVAAAMVGAGCASAPAGGGGGKAESKAPPTEAEMQAAWMKAMTPGEPHARMKRQCGEWDVTAKMWMQPGAPPMESKGKATMKMIFGDRYQLQDYQGDFMGMPFTGMGITGYDNVTGKWFSTWIDSMSTCQMVSEGYSSGKDTFVFEGTFPDPVGGTMKMRMVLTEKGPDTILFEAYTLGGPWQEEAKCMEMTYTRKK